MRSGSVSGVQQFTDSTYSSSSMQATVLDKGLWSMFTPSHTASCLQFEERVEDAKLLSGLAEQAHHMLKNQPAKVLANLLVGMEGNTVMRMQLAPYLLAILQTNEDSVKTTAHLSTRRLANLPLKIALSAVDIEKALCKGQVEAWPYYPQHAADLMRPVHPILEVGYANYIAGQAHSSASLAEEALSKESEACGVVTAGSFLRARCSTSTERSLRMLEPM